MVENRLLKRGQSRPLTARVRQRFTRAVKFARRRLKNMRGSTANSRAIFVFGKQRSGTRLPMDVMARSPDIITYPEGHSTAFNRSLLKNNDSLLQLLRTSPFPHVAFKPICESHRAAELLDVFPRARGIWIFRDFKDVTNSAVKKWPAGHENLMRLASGDLESAGWRAGGLTGAKIELVRQLYGEDMPSHDAHALMWYLRNDLFFELELDRRDDLLLVKYEDLVASPAESFAKVFRFLDCPFRKSFVTGVYSTSIARDPFPEIFEEIRERCVTLGEKLQHHHGQQPTSVS